MTVQERQVTGRPGLSVTPTSLVLQGVHRARLVVARVYIVKHYPAVVYGDLRMQKVDCDSLKSV